MSPGKISSASLLSQSASTHGPSASGEPGVPSRVGPTNNPGGVPGFFLARCCLGQVPGGAPFSQRSEQATACTNRMQIRN